jgi:hypothetical protein
MPPLQGNILLRDLELAEHVLIKGVVNVELYPVQSAYTLFELLGQLSVNRRCTQGRGIHLGNDSVGTAACLCVIGWADRSVARGEAFRKKPEIEECQVADVFVIVAPPLRRHLAGSLREHIKQILGSLSRFVSDPIHVFYLNEFRQQVSDVTDGVVVMEVELAQTPLSQLLKENSNGMPFWNISSCFLNHVPFPLLT